MSLRYRTSLVLLGLTLLGATAAFGQQPPPPPAPQLSEDAKYWNAQAITFAKGLQACQQTGTQSELQLAEDQRRLTVLQAQQQADQDKLKALQQQVTDLEAKVKEYETLTMSGK